MEQELTLRIPASASAVASCERQGQTAVAASPWYLGMPEAFLGVLIFSMTLPAMRIALRDLDPVVVGVGRMCVAAVPSLLLLLWTGGVPRLTLRQFFSLMITAACLTLGFAWLTAMALQHVPSSHAAIVIGSIPLAMAVISTLRNGKKQSAVFWIGSSVGCLLIICYGLAKSGMHIEPADLLLLLAALACATGYVEGARLSRQIGTLTLTCLVPLASAPLAVLLCWHHLPASFAAVRTEAWIAFLYNGLFSTFVGFLFWYRGLAKGDTARIAQIQLVQPFLSLLGAVVLLHETLGVYDWITATCAVACISLTQSKA